MVALPTSFSRYIPEKFQKLDRYRPIQAELFFECSTLLKGSFQRQHQLDGIADHTGDDKHDYRHPQNDNGPMPESF